MPLVSEVMTHRPTAILQTANVRAALAAMLELDVRHLPVVNADRELVGMLSDRDLRAMPSVTPEVNALMEDEAPSLDVPLASIMSSDVISVEPTDDLRNAVELMLENRVGAVPVVTPDNRLVGIVSYIDVLRLFQEELEAEAGR